MADGDITIEPFSRYVVITRMGLETRRASLDVYTRELAVAESQVNREALKVQEWGKRHGIKTVRRNIGINPSDGVVGVTVEFNRSVTTEEVADLGK